MEEELNMLWEGFTLTEQEAELVKVKNEALRELRVELSKKHKAQELDGFGLYL